MLVKQVSLEATTTNLYLPIVFGGDPKNKINNRIKEVYWPSIRSIAIFATLSRSGFET